MAYNSTLYQPNQYMNTGMVNYPLYNNNQNNMVMNQQPVYPQFTTPPLSLSAAYTKGEIGASSFPVASGNTVVLLDSDTIDTDNPIIYIKTTGYDGKPQTIKKITGTVSYPNEQGLFTVPVQEIVKEVEKPEINLENYVTKDEFSTVKENIDLISVQIDDYEKALNKINESIANIDGRFNNMFNAFSGNNVINTENKTEEKEVNNSSNYNNKKNKSAFKERS